MHDDFRPTCFQSRHYSPTHSLGAERHLRHRRSRAVYASGYGVRGRFAEFFSMDSVGEECRKLAGEAVVSMTKVEERYHGV
jgi:hypothetical protein